MEVIAALVFIIIILFLMTVAIFSFVAVGGALTQGMYVWLDLHRVRGKTRLAMTMIGMNAWEPLLTSGINLYMRTIAHVVLPPFWYAVVVSVSILLPLLALFGYGGEHEDRTLMLSLARLVVLRFAVNILVFWLIFSDRSFESLIFVGINMWLLARSVKTSDEWLLLHGFTS